MRAYSAHFRPSTRIMQQYGVIEQFQKSGIGAIINLQLAGEHQSCGDGISDVSGFSYIPEDFMNANSMYCLRTWLREHVWAGAMG